MPNLRCLDAARRLACFLDTIDIRPTLEQRTTRERYRFLLELYSALPRELRREARRRKPIRRISRLTLRTTNNLELLHKPFRLFFRTENGPTRD